ncbi:MAG: prenyltransferase/squalene oxidase repeat-containing protein [Akkermansiaceae bacterium]|jgi:hypothetical protein
MSLHAQLSPEAQARLDAMKRNSTISSIVIALLSIVLIGLLLAFIFIKPLFKETPVIVTYSANVPAEEVLETKKVTTSSKQKPSAPSSSSAKVIAAATTSNVAIPVPEVDVPQPSTDFGNGNDFGDGWGSGGDGGGGGGGFGAIPATMRKRCSREDRLQRLAETGGNEQCEEAVLKSLRWMKKTQNADGSWGTGNKAAMTGLGLLAYLGHCETPTSDEFGESCLKAMTFLIQVGMQNQGKLAQNFGGHGWVYEHSIAVYALSEATTFCKQLNVNVPNLSEITQKAGQFLIDNQHKNGGWAYSYDEGPGAHTDVSVTGWHIQALKAMKHTGLDFKNLSRCSSKGLEYLKDKQDSDGGFGYNGKGLHGGLDYHTLTGVGVLCFQMWGKESSSEVRKGAKYISKNTKLKWGTPFVDLYGHYYEAQAMMNRGGQEWKDYNAMMRDEVLRNQNADGTWKSPDGKLRAVGPQFQGGDGQSVFYRNALCTLMLEVYYRFLPGTGSH